MLFAYRSGKMIDEIAKKEYLKHIEKELGFYEDSPYDEIPRAIMSLKDKFLELYNED